MNVKLLGDMTQEEKLDVIKNLIEQFTKSDERENGLKRKLADEELLVKEISDMIAGDEVLPSECPYESLSDWLVSAKKAIVTTEKSIAKIEEQKVEIEAFQYYVDSTEAS